jgi:G3E family GTPase
VIPVTVLTGFLGSGKTTVLRHVLRDPAFCRTAVIINEFGEIGIDHDLIETSDESFIQLTTGCLCCKVRSDLVRTLADLATRRGAGTVIDFERVVIETSGLADPAPVMHALMTDCDLAETYALHRVVTTVDAVHGMATLDHHEQSMRQAAVADSLVLTKTDLADATALTQRLHALNAGAAVELAVHGALSGDALFAPPVHDAAALHRNIESLVAPAAHAHDQGITSFCVVRDIPLHAVTLALLLEALAENCGAKLLRVKGLVNVAEEPDRPAVIHGVQHVFYPMTWLERWPSADRRSRIVFIAQDVPPSWVRHLVDLIEEEVREETSHAAKPGFRVVTG